MNNIAQRLREYSQMASATGHAICNEAADIIDSLSKIIDELIVKDLKENPDPAVLIDNDEEVEE